MKRIISFLLFILLMAGTALAETVREQIGAPGYVQTVFLSNTGKTEITVDAQVVVPEAERIPVIAVEKRLFTDAEFLAVADAVLGKGNYQKPLASIAADAHPEQADNDYPFNITIRTEDRYASFYMHRAHSGVMSYCMIYARPRDSHTTYWFGAPPYRITSRETPEEIRSQALEIAALAMPELSLALEGAVSDQGLPGPHTGYMFCFTRTVNGVPTTYTFTDCTALDSANDLMYIVPFLYERAFLILGLDGGIWLYYNSPYQLGETLEESPVLLPFDQIMAIAEQILPLSLTSQERYLETRGESKVTRQVDRIVLGYSRVQLRDKRRADYALIPVWDFMNAAEPDGSLLTINAMDGTIVDRGFGY